MVQTLQNGRRLLQRSVHDFIRGSTDGGTYRVPFPSKKIVGVYSTRGSRPYQEDATSIHGLNLPVDELKYTLSKNKADVEWNPEKAGSEFLASQVAFFGIYDGHGGKAVSTYLQSHLHEHVENAASKEIGSLIDYTVSHGGYFKRFRGGALHRWSKWAHALPPEEGSPMTLEERLTVAFLEADKEVLTAIPGTQRIGSTASIALLHSLDEPGQPYWSAKKLGITIGHCGDTRILLCHRPSGEVQPLTEKHHAEARVEAARLRRMGGGRLVADSFGESRWMGVIENTRGFGDGEWKTSGVTAEPDVTSKVVNGDDYSYMILVTDGLTSMISDQEIVDLARNSIDPTRAAKTIVEFGEDLGAQDNCTCIVVPLAGWGKVGGQDNTEERREYRRRRAGELSTRMQRM
ncbi:protein phosphatase PTC6, partial [Tremellales sp. Uapishka_1]